jgi:hypothetical protein
MKTKKLDLDKIKAEAEQTVVGWLEKESIPSRVTRALDGRVVEIASKLMGFTDHYGKWEVDHCNGRSGNSAVGDYLREKCGAAAKEWIDQLADKLPPLPKSARKSLVESYHQRLIREVRAILENQAREDAVELASKIIREASGVEEVAKI